MPFSKHIRSIIPGSSLARKFMIWALALGCAYTAINPPFAVNDERDHWLRARELSYGRLTTRSDAAGPYYQLPKDYYDLIRRYANVQRKAEDRVDVPRLWRDLTRRRHAKSSWIRLPANASGYSPIPYLPHIPAIWLARALHLPTLWQIYLARLSSLLCYALLSAWAVFMAGRLGWVFFVLGLMPMALTQAAGLSGDGVTNALSLLFFALLAKGMLRAAGPLSREELALLSGLNLLLGLCKLPYLLSAMALGALRWEGPRAHAKRFVYAGATALFGACAHGLWLYINRGVATSDPGTLGEQVVWVLGHPFGAVQALLRSLFTSADDYLIQLVVFRDLIHRHMRFLGGLIAAGYLQLLVLVSWGSAFGQRPSGRERFWAVSLLSLGALLMAGAILLAMYLIASPVGAERISGVQGRYFIPVVPALLLALSVYGRPNLSRWLTRAGGGRVLVPLAALHVLCLCALLARYFGSAALDWPL